MNTVDEYWEVDGVSLNVPGWNITTLGGRFNVPALRGDDATYAYVPGEEFRPEKVPAARILTFAMWLTGADPATGALTTDQRRMWNDNWKFLTKLFWKPRRQFVLTRRWLLTDPDTEEGVIQTTTTLGQYVSGLEPSMTGRTRATFTVDVKLCDPFFYGTQIETTVPKNTPTTVTNSGDFDAAHRNLTVEFVGPLTNPKLTNATPTPDVWVKYNNIISAGEELMLDIEDFTAVASAPEVGIPELSLVRDGYITHSGTRQWFGLIEGTNSLTLTADSGAGHAVVRFRPPYL